MMRREQIAARRHWQSRVEQIGFTFHSIGGVYWNEAACYVFEEAEIELIESVTATLHSMCLEAVELMVRSGDYYDRLAIPEGCRSRIELSWRLHEPALYGRFDLSYNGNEPPKLLEYNADTPTSVYEAAVVQWFWLKEVRPEANQFNSIHEKLIEQWRLLLHQQSYGSTLHFSSLRQSEEDFLTVEYLRDTAQQAGFETDYLAVEDVGWAAKERLFVDLKNSPMRRWFKLYPWEWLIRDPFGQHLLTGEMQMLEPWWKLLLSNKGLLAVLWELFPNHPNLLPAYFDPAPLRDGYVRKPLLGREGANVEIITPQQRLHSPGSYGSEGWVYQAPALLPCFDGNHAVVGSWVVGEQPAGIGMREDDTAITRDTSRFVPHCFK